MSTRQTKPSRADKASATRRAILDAAKRLLGDAEHGPISVEAVAAAAGVTRVTVYNQFGSRHGLLDAVFAELAERGGMDRLLELTADLPAREACRETIERTCRFWHSERLVLRRLNGLAVLDAELATIFDTREGWRRRQLARLVDRLEAETDAKYELPRRAVVDTFLALTSFQTYDRMGSLTRHPTQAARVLDQLLTGLLR